MSKVWTTQDTFDIADSSSMQYANHNIIYEPSTVNGLARQGSLPLWKSDSFFVLCLRHDKPFSGPCVDSMRRMDNCCSLRHLLPMQTTTRTCRYRYRQERVLIGSEPAVIPIEDASDIKLIAVFLYSMYFLEKFCFLLYCYFSLPYSVLSLLFFI